MRARAIADMTRPRVGHVAVLLASGEVLIAGGAGEPSASCERFDPRSATFVGAAAMRCRRNSAGAVRLPDGRVLVAGGRGADPDDRRQRPDLREMPEAIRNLLLASDCLVAAELFDPARNAWTDTGRLGRRRENPELAILPDGRVLAVGGFDGGEGGPNEVEHGDVRDVELWDAATGAWTGGPALPAPRRGGRLFVTGSGAAVLAGGDTYPDHAAHTFVLAAGAASWDDHHGSLSRTRFAAERLADGRILVVGGDAEGGALAFAETYDPSTGRWSEVEPMAEPRADATATRLRDGRVLIAGGVPEIREPDLSGPIPDTSTWLAPPLDTTEVFDPRTGRFTPGPRLTRPRTAHVAVALADGCVLLLGGYDHAAFEPTAAAEIVEP